MIKPNEDERFKYALSHIYQLFQISGFSTTTCQIFTKKMKDCFFEEFNGNTALRKKLNQKFQKYTEFLDNQVVLTNTRSKTSQYLLQIQQESNDLGNFQSILSSVIHMMINRIFNTKQRAYEMILYHCLSKQYDSIVAKNLMKNNCNGNC